MHQAIVQGRTCRIDFVIGESTPEQIIAETQAPKDCCQINKTHQPQCSLATGVAIESTFFHQKINATTEVITGKERRVILANLTSATKCCPAALQTGGITIGRQYFTNIIGDQHTNQFTGMRIAIEVPSEVWIERFYPFSRLITTQGASRENQNSDHKIQRHVSVGIRVNSQLPYWRSPMEKASVANSIKGSSLGIQVQQGINFFYLFYFFPRFCHHLFSCNRVRSICHNRLF